ncbi:MFS transporter [Enterobacter asburiae]|uniref:MFS transporter n=1 Tax=Enterobacter TaxID=547 RepID=UPI002004C729|nr:MFS transporter [Enterobacter bugandensis]MCK6736069.1 MFS transporter [Enterobacter bugandensis]MCM7470899.1 MFS transporter [Enterobacter bugandensis]HCM9227714.1 MFS transporter [Enterobacter bugandensis]HCM9673891.1 MFS transporter [Enterobacter roggenkampii]
MPQVTQIFNHKILMRIAIIIAYIQFTNALEYMALAPVFSFMAEAFSVPVSFSGYVSGMYTLGAVLSGVAAFYWIDRFDKKRFLMQNMLLLGALTFASTFTTNFNTLLALRFCAGLVGGTTMGVGTSILINYSPVNMRGKMLATVIASFSIVSIVGMPSILFLCTHYGWHISLWSISFLCLLPLPLIVLFIPGDAAQSRAKNKLPIDAQTLLFASCNALVQFSPMLIIPILTPLMTQHLGVQQDQLPLLFLSGGIAGYLSTKITGVLTSRFSALILATISTFLFVISLLIPAMGYHSAVLFITLFLGASYSRLVSSSSVTIQYPADEQRASFSSLQAALMSLITTLAFFLSSLLLPDHSITAQNLDLLLIVCALAATGFPLMVMVLQKKLAKRTHQPDHVVND